MNNRERKNNKNSGFTGIAVIAALALMQIATGAGGSVIFLIAVLIVMAVVGFALARVLVKKGGAGGTFRDTEKYKELRRRMVGEAERALDYSARRKQSTPGARREIDRPKIFSYPGEGEESIVRCTHYRGKEKYIHQLDGFLANGLIDKAEYRKMKERYEKLDIPQDLH